MEVEMFIWSNWSSTAGSKAFTSKLTCSGFRGSLSDWNRKPFTPWCYGHHLCFQRYSLNRCLNLFTLSTCSLYTACAGMYRSGNRVYWRLSLPTSSSWSIIFPNAVSFSLFPFHHLIYLRECFHILLITFVILWEVLSSLHCHALSIVKGLLESFLDLWSKPVPFVVAYLWL